ncbi:MAG: hypothetical protein ACYTGQ_10520, partial [Planctomycetota bacterium]|jgi:hypothetical protein
MLVQDTVDEADWELLKTPAAEIDAEQADALIAASGALLKLFDQAIELPECDWGLEDIGIDTLLPYLHSMRQFSRVTDLRARRRFDTGNNTGAVRDLLASLQMARHTGADGILLGRLVGAAMERHTIDVAASNLHRLSLDQLRQLESGLDRLDLSPYPADAAFIHSEKRFVVTWIAENYNKKDPEAFYKYLGFDDEVAKRLAGLGEARTMEVLAEVGAFYDQAIPMLKLPYAQRIKALSGLEDRVVTSGNTIAATMFPAMSKACDVLEAARARFAMLRAAVAHRQGAEQLFNAIGDPGANGKAFEVATDSGGFTLTSKVKDKGEALSIRFGK